jgi:ATP-dependent Zn protease
LGNTKIDVKNKSEVTAFMRPVRFDLVVRWFNEDAKLREQIQVYMEANTP